MKRLLLIVLGLMLAGRVTAQTFTNLHNFTGSDGRYASGGLILSDNTLYGTTQFGGSSDKGTVFAVNIDGTGFTNLHSFANSDGIWPLAGLILSSNTLYGTTYRGGSSNIGTVFAVNTNGTGFTNLHHFTGSDGAELWGGLILSSNTLYGTTSAGGSSNNGTVFAVNTDGMGFTNLHKFTGSDGSNLFAGLVLSGNTLYGTAYNGGSSGNGTVFAINTNGTGFTTLYSFTAGSGSLPNVTNSDGAYPFAGLILSGNTLYGTAKQGGIKGSGTIFKIKTDGSGFTNLYSFPRDGGIFLSTGLSVLSGNILYGTTSIDGDYGNGSVFAINTDGAGLTTLYSFAGYSSSLTNNDGVGPHGLVLSGNTLYGVAALGGNSGNGTIFGSGTVFSLSFAPQLTIIPAGADVVLSWPTNAAGFTLQSTTNLVPPAVWSTVSPAPFVVNGQNTVTNPISATQSFYRLMHP